MNYQIKNTTKEQRQQYVENGLSLGSLGGVPPTKQMMELLQKYVSGEMELEEIKQNVIQRYQTT